MSEEDTQRTPGPWRAWNPIGESWAVSEVLDKSRPLAPGMGHRVADEIDRKADAILISEAPALAEAVSRLLDETKCKCDGNGGACAYHFGHAVLVRARGGR